MRKYNHEMLHVTRYALHDNKGFTLIELILVMAIAGIMSVVVVSQYSQQRDYKALLLGEEQIANDIRMAQSYSYNILMDNGSFSVGGYGINFSSVAGSNSKYIIFADNDDDGVFDSGEEFEEIELPKNINIKSLKITDNSTSSVTSFSSVDLIFKPPYGKVKINGDEKLGGEFIGLEIEIENPDGLTKKIEMSSSRLIK